MIELNTEVLEMVAKDINAVHKIEARKEEYKRYLMYNGKTKEIIREALDKEFNKPETVNELIGRLVPINIVEKIINKLAGVYVEAPNRTVEDESETDTELMNDYEHYLELNQIMKQANRHLKLFKRFLIEMYIDENGWPGLRLYPRHRYEVYAHDTYRKTRPNIVALIKKWDVIPENQIIVVWSDIGHKVINGHGQIIPEIMIKMDNVDGINPYGELPFIYQTTSIDEVDPIPDDDLLKAAIAIPVVLTDLLFAVKYQAWSILWTIGPVGDIPGNPSSVISLQYGPGGEKPEIGTVKPEIDIVAILQLIANIMSMLLTTKNLSAKTIATTQSVEDLISGISKALDNAESVEDKADQQAYFFKAENDLWTKLSEYMIPYWRETNQLVPELDSDFSDAFSVNISFQEPKILLSQKEKVENSKQMLDVGLTTLKRELKKHYPDYNDTAIDELYEEILREKGEFLAVQTEVATRGIDIVEEEEAGNGIQPQI